MNKLKQATEKLNTVIHSISPWVYLAGLVIVFLIPQTFKNIPLKQIIVKVETVDLSTIVNSEAPPNPASPAARFQQMVTYTIRCAAASTSDVCDATALEFHFPATPPPSIDITLNRSNYNANIQHATFDGNGRKKYKITLSSMTAKDELKIVSGIKGHVDQEDLDLLDHASQDLIGHRISCSKIAGDNWFLICNESPTFVQRISAISPF